MTTTNNPARAATAGELVKYRSQRAVVFTARINQASFAASVDEITYDTSTGTYTDVKAGMFCWIGTTAGAKNRGIARVRTTASATKIFINPNSEIAFADDLYLTIYTNPRQSSVPRLAIQHPATVYTARINQTFTTADKITELTYDTGAGVLADVLEGMTAFIGSGTGLSDKGMVRVRKTPSATVLYIGETSNVQFANNDFITIVDRFDLWARPLNVDAGVVRMDDDIEYGDTDRGGVIARLGPVAAVIEQTTGTLTFTPVNPSLSAAYDGAAITGYVFAAPGASTTANMTNPATASWTYPLTADSEYRFSCAITDDLTRTTTGYRRVFVNPAEIPFELNNVSGDYETGDWSFTVTCRSDVSGIYDRALAVLYVRDYHGKTVDNIGKLAGYENIIAQGWIDGESVEQDANSGMVTFTVRGAAQWMSRIIVDPLELTDTFIDPTTWGQIETMTVDKIMALVFYWMTTATRFMDVFLTGDSKRIRLYSMAGGNLLSEISAVAGKIFARPAVNSYGQMFVDIDAQMADAVTQAAFPIVLDITSADYQEPFEIDRSTNERTGMVQLGGLQDADGVTDIFLYSRAPGNIPNQFGNVSTYDDYIFVNSDECLILAGRLLAVENNQFDTLQITFPSSIRLFDIAPRMVAIMTTSAASNPRGIALTAQKLIPRQVSYSFDEGSPRTVVTLSLR